MIWKAWRQFRARRARREFFKLLALEISQNLETCYIIQQLGQLRPFDLRVWQQAAKLPNLLWPREILIYVERLTEFNSALRVAQEYEQWYSSNLDNQSHDNAQLLHAHKESAQEKFVGLELIIKNAQPSLEQFKK